MRWHRSALAVLAGGLVAVALSYGADAVARLIGAMDDTIPESGSTALVALVLGYRTVFNVVGCWVAARLAPNHPMRHALILGGLGTLAALGGTASSVPGPGWYAWGLVLGALPAAWLGGWIHTTRPKVAELTHQGSPLR